MHAQARHERPRPDTQTARILREADEAAVAEPPAPGDMVAVRRAATLALADVGVGADDAGARSVVLSTAERPAREAGTIIVDDGTAAQQLVDYLVAERLV